MRIGAPPPGLASPRRDEARPAAAGGTFGFDELGVFGLRREAGAAREAGVRTPRCATPPDAGPAAPAKEPATIVATPSPPDGPAPNFPLPPRPAAAGVPDMPPAPRPEPEVRSIEIGEGGALLDVSFTQEPDAMQGGDGAAATPDRPKAAKASPALSLSEQNGQVAIVAAAPPLDGEGRALLRRLVREILAARGLGLADFQLNGAPLGADFNDMTGGTYGPRSR